VAQRLSLGGLSFTVDAYARELGPELCTRHGLLEVDEVYVGQRG
jgi:hypothetical protein